MSRRFVIACLTVTFVCLAITYMPLSCTNSAGDAREASAKSSQPTAEPLPLDQWTYIQIDSSKSMWGEYDEPEWLRYFGLATGDVDGDGDADIITGRNTYLNPGDDLAAAWIKEDLGANVDANLSDGEGAIFAEALPDVWRYRRGADGTYVGEVIAQVPATGHHNGQGYRYEDMDGDGQPEIVYASLGGVFAVKQGAEPPFATHLLALDASDEGFAIADMDGDGDPDIVAGFRAPGGDPEVPTYVSWFENQGTLELAWPRHHVGRTTHATDRIEAGDLDGDGRTDVAIAEERYPCLEPDASLYLSFQRDTGFVREKLVTQYSMNNLDFADMDADGDLDVVTAEHKGDRLALQVWVNDGAGGFGESPTEIDRGKENHLGARTVDIDGDGDLDIVGIGWDQHQYVHLWRNDAR